MKQSYLFLAPGFEEVEALTVADLMRRAGLQIQTVSVNESDRMVTGAHGITVKADLAMNPKDITDADWLIIPGGMPGATNCAACAPLTDLLVSHYRAGGRIAAICAAPAVVLAPLGILVGKSATCYPGFENALIMGGVNYLNQAVVALPQFITANGPASAMTFALAIISATAGQEKAEEIATATLYK